MEKPTSFYFYMFVENNLNFYRLMIDIRKQKTLGRFALNGVQKVRTFNTTGKIEYSKSDFLCKLIATSDENGLGTLPLDLSLFMNGGKESGEVARKYLQELQDLGLIWYKTDSQGRPSTYLLTL